MVKRPPKLHQSKGYWFLVFYEPWRDSKPRKWVALGTTSKRRANEMQLEMTKLYLNNSLYPWKDQQRSIALSEAIEEHLASKRVNSKGTTMRSLEVVLGPFKERYGSRALSSITPKEVLAFAQRDGLSAQTVKRRLVTLKSLFRWHYNLGEEVNEKIFLLKPPRVAKRPPRFMSYEERDALESCFLEADESFWSTHQAWRLGYSSGLRPIDVVNLKRSNVTEGFIEVVASKYDGWRVPLFPIAAEVVAASNTPYVIERNGKEDPVFLTKKFQKIVKQSGIAPITLYEATRHTFASWLVQRDVNIVRISKWMGHKDLNTTMIYAHLAPGQVPEQAYEVFK